MFRSIIGIVLVFGSFNGFAQTPVAQPQLPRLLLWAKPGLNCQKCEASLQPVRTLLNSEAQKRGYSPHWLNPREITGILGPSSETQASAILKAKNSAGATYAGVLMVEWAPAPPDDDDSAHADENKYVMKSHLHLQNFSQSLKKELLDTDSFEESEASVLLELFSKFEAAAGLEKQGAVAAELVNEEVLLEVTGFKDFAQFTQVRAQLTQSLKEMTSQVEDRKFSKGKAVLAIYPKVKGANLKGQLSQMPFHLGDPSVKVSVQ